MSRVCSVCDKGSMSGNKVSHSNRKSRRIFAANVQKIRLNEKGAIVSKYVCTRCIKAGKIQRA